MLPVTTVFPSDLDGSAAVQQPQHPKRIPKESQKNLKRGEESPREWMETEIIEEIYLPESCVGPGGKVALHCCADGADAANPFPPECPHRRAEILPSSLRKYFSQFNGWNWTKQAPKSAQKKNGIASRHTHTHTHSHTPWRLKQRKKELIDFWMNIPPTIRE